MLLLCYVVDTVNLYHFQKLIEQYELYYNNSSNHKKENTKSIAKRMIVRMKQVGRIERCELAFLRKTLKSQQTA